MSVSTPEQALLVEGPVSFAFEGQTFEAGGTVITESRISGAYLGTNGVLNSAHGRAIGRFRITSTWPTPRTCFMSSTRSQVVATVQGRTYQGQSFGKGMLFNGKRLAAELKRASR